ncbi:unannotated protein [freshwater metagenome]|uniref:Unannotated protein n=1 Tax=freshwater metagenome TaxID=449393 RepID=A0A6J7CS47_9ZZZZ|nr:cyclic nucleotide-binding domain-containing protein [Actinomycetota bacterium]
MLRRIPLFGGCSRGALSRIAAICRDVDAPAGSVLLAEGTTGSDFFLVVAGTAVVSRADQQLSELGPGDFFGEISLVAAVPRTATVTATSDVKLLAIAERDFPVLLGEQPRLAERIQSQLVRRLADDANRNSGE